MKTNMSCWCVSLLLFSVGFHYTSSRNVEDENSPLVILEAVQGTVGRLPCNVTPPMPEDKVALVIWYKEGHSKPIYSLDTRNSNFAKGTHWVEENFGGRASFQTGQSPEHPAVLTIKATKNTDSGIYRCRVDFQKSPTRNSKVQLKVIIPPEKLVILDDTGNHIPHYILGPYNEGTSINITCVSTGGRPLPNVTWWFENTLLDDSFTVLSERRVSNVLHLKKLERRHLNRVLTCQALNNNLTAPITSAVTLDLNLRPLIVKLQGEKRPLSADSSYKLNCVVIGSRPAPTITWWKGSTPMRNTRDETTADGNITTSTLTFTPTIDDRGKFLSCRAEQTLIPESGMEDGWKLDIYHIPVVSLEFGTNLNTTTIREGADVFFECNIKSNPWVYRVSWRHNGNILDNNLPEGIVVANQSLVLQNVSRARSGLYTCVGSNREGDGESNPVQLDIRFAPICRPGQKTVYSSGRQELVKVVCEVEANPTDVTFLWKFNVSAVEFVDIPASLIATDRARSIAHYTPMTEHDYGTLLCWATNEIGSQGDPCVYTIIPAGEPDPLTNCTVLNQTSNSFQVECVEGFDGGLDQDFVMEVYVNGTTRNPKIYKSKSAYFEVRGLNPGIGYNVFLVAQNRKGRSNSTVMQVYTLKDPEKQTDLSLAYAPVIEDIRPFLGILLGIVGSIFLVALIIVIIVRMRGSSGRDRNNYSHQVSRDTLHNGQSIQDMRIGRETCQTSSADSMDKNPDIIPQDMPSIDEHEDDDEWTTTTTKNGSNHNRTYATAALAEQNAIITSGTYDRIPYAVIDKKPIGPSQQSLLHQQQHQQQHQHLPTPQYITTYNTLIPVSKMGYATQPNKTDLTYAELAVATQPAPGQRIPYSSATLGRPRQTEAKRLEPTIYAQIDLAHHPMYSTSSMYGANANTGVTMSHLSQLATFPAPPPIFTHNPVGKITTTSSMAPPPTLQATSVLGISGIPVSLSGTVGGGGGLIIGGHATSSVPVCYSEAGSTPVGSVLKTVPEEVHTNSINDEVSPPKDRNINHATRF